MSPTALRSANKKVRDLEALVTQLQEENTALADEVKRRQESYMRREQQQAARLEVRR